MLLDAMKQKLFMKEFIDTDLPSTWQVIVEPYIDPQEAGQPGQGSPSYSTTRGSATGKSTEPARALEVNFASQHRSPVLLVQAGRATGHLFYQELAGCVFDSFEL